MIQEAKPTESWKAAMMLPCIFEIKGDGKNFRRNWARLIQNIYETAPLICLKRQGNMRTIIFIK